MTSTRDHARPASVRLRTVERADLPALFEHQRDPEAYQLAAVFPREESAFYERWEQTLANPEVTARAITADGILVGTISSLPIDDATYVGYWVARASWGQGIATRALQLILKEVGTRPIHARVAKHNAGSIRVLIHSGFEISGYEHSPATDRFTACEEAVLVLN
jgi:RimJ/RimL family protein N-acetyltransferase